VYLDYDSAGKQAMDKAILDGVLTPSACKMSICKGKNESEFEDCFDSKIYIKKVSSRFGVDLNKNEFKSNSKWSDRVKNCFMTQGVDWNDKVESTVKEIVAESIVENLGSSLLEHQRSSIDALVDSLERLIKLD
jgi:hypothetical protein